MFEHHNSLQTTKATNQMRWLKKIPQYLRSNRPFSVDRIFLYLALCMALGGICSAHYHFFMQNYSPFVMQQVLPATDKMHWAEKALRGVVPAGKVPAVRLDSWPWASPLFRNQNVDYGEALIPTGSDYLGVWHYTGMILAGLNPYDINFYFTYNFQAYDWPMLKDPKVPAQIVGPFSYPPFAALLIIPFFSSNYFLSLLSYYIVFGIFLLLGAGWIIQKASRSRIPLIFLLGTVFLSSSPFALLLDRGNIEGILFILTTLGIIAYTKNKFYISIFFIALAACCKFYPAIFMGLFILDRRWKPLLFGLVSIPLITFGSLMTINSPISQTISQFLTNLGGVNEFFLFDGRSIQFSHTLCTLISGTFFANFANPNIQSLLRTFCALYPILIGILTIIIFLRLSRFDLRTRVCSLSVMMIFFPFISNDYTLIYLYLPFGWLLLDATKKVEWSIMDVLPLCLLGLISIPKQYLVGLFGLGPGISFAINGIALGALLFLFLNQKASDSQPEQDSSFIET